MHDGQGHLGTPALASAHSAQREQIWALGPVVPLPSARGRAKLFLSRLTCIPVTGGEG